MAGNSIIWHMILPLAVNFQRPNEKKQGIGIPLLHHFNLTISNEILQQILDCIISSEIPMESSSNSKKLGSYSNIMINIDQLYWVHLSSNNLPCKKFLLFG